MYTQHSTRSSTTRPATAPYLPPDALTSGTSRLKSVCHRRPPPELISSDNHRRTTVRDSFSPEEEQRVGQSLLLACDLAGFSNERLTAMATVHAGRRGDYSKDSSAGWEREYVGLMSILASRDRSVLVEEDSERQGTTYVDFPRRLASRRRLEHREHPSPTHPFGRRADSGQCF